MEDQYQYRYQDRYRYQYPPLLPDRNQNISIKFNENSLTGHRTTITRGHTDGRRQTYGRSFTIAIGQDIKPISALRSCWHYTTLQLHVHCKYRLNMTVTWIDNPKRQTDVLTKTSQAPCRIKTGRRPIAETAAVRATSQFVLYQPSPTVLLLRYVPQGQLSRHKIVYPPTAYCSTCLHWTQSTAIPVCAA
jgi:hypothetical protein